MTTDPAHAAIKADIDANDFIGDTGFF